MYRRIYGDSKGQGGKGGGVFGKGGGDWEGKGKGGDSWDGKGKGGGGWEGKGKGKGNVESLPKALRNKAKYGKKKGGGGGGGGGGGTAPKTPKTCVNYGPKKNRDRFKLDLDFLRMRFSWLVDDIDKNDKEKEEEEEETRIPEKEVEELPELRVQKINFHIRGKAAPGSDQKVPGNAKKHHTDKYKCCTGKDALPVFRRGQEFKVTVTFNRPYDLDQDDLVLMVECDEDNPSKSLSANFKLDEERTKPFTEGQHWAARIKKKLPEKNALKLAVYIPGNCVVAEWDLKVKTSLRGNIRKCVYTHPKPFTVLFNPWSEQDQVHYTDDKEDLKEYVLNDKSTAYFGCASYVQSKPWTYGQFEEGILQICLRLLRQAFDWKMTSAMGNPVLVSRAISRIVNSAGDNGVLTGNWSGDYEGGTNPCRWASSTAILRQHHETKEPVRFGQCWVFSHVLTAVCRALGLPCRSVTNFDSAHDTDGSCTIDNYCNEDGDDLPGMKTDSIWNFHVWNEAWMARPEIAELDCNGWQVIDATPQEQSDGVYQCGPCPVKAVKNGWIHVPYDTAFVFAEVNADVLHWVVDETGDLTKASCKQKAVGNRISTKPPNGKPSGPNLTFSTMDKPEHRCDLTGHYKYPEGSPEERAAVKRAVLQTSRGTDVYEDSTDLDVDFEDGQAAMLGDDLKATVVVKNMSQEDKEVNPVLSARTSCYWNDPDKTKVLCKEKPGVVTIRPGGEKKFQITVPSSLYSKECDDSMTVYIHALAKDIKRNMPHTVQKPFKLGIPDLVVKAPDEAKPKENMKVHITMTNPLDIPLTSCMLTMKGDLCQCDDDPNLFESFFWEHYLDHRDLKPKESVTIVLKLYMEEEHEDEDSDEEDPDDDGEEAEAPEPEAEEVMKMQSFELSCAELYPITGSCQVKCCDH